MKVLKKILIVAVFVVTVVCLITAAETSAFAATQNALDLSTFAMDFDTGTILFENKADEKRPIASMVKIMTLLLGWEAVDAGLISLDQSVMVSDTAAAMGGSQMFLEAGDVYTVGELLKGITVVSANDASVQLAELLAGSQEAFTVIMNEKAAQLNMSNTLFANCTGLPSEAQQYSTARDVSTMLKELLKHENYYMYSKVYMEDFHHPDGRITEFVNTNKLVRFYNDCDGGKTGFTNEAMFCLSATAKRDDMRVIATVIGANDSKTRFAEVSRLFNYAFSNYTVKTLIDTAPIENNLSVVGGKEQTINIAPKSQIKVLCEKNACDFKVVTDIVESIEAPISIGQTIGTVKVFDKEGNVVGETEIVSLSEVAEKTYWDALLETLRNWTILS